MPELPDIVLYIEALAPRLVGRMLQELELRSPFLLRTVEPKVEDVIDHEIVALRRIGKRICLRTDNDIWLVMHLMIAGRLNWRTGTPSKLPRSALCHFHFETGVLSLTESSKKKRASLHLVSGEKGLAALDPRGLEVLNIDRDTFRQRLVLRNHTLKRALTDPRLFSGIGNAYSDEILHRARLSPIAHTHKLTDPEVIRLYDAIQYVMSHWIGNLREEYGDQFPTKVTAFRPGMAVHGRFGQPCPVCATQIQRIRFAENELNYCPRCQTNGRVLADRSLSRLLKKDWPRTIEQLENIQAGLE